MLGTTGRAEPLRCLLPCRKGRCPYRAAQPWALPEAASDPEGNGRGTINTSGGSSIDFGTKKCSVG